MNPLFLEWERFIIKDCSVLKKIEKSPYNIFKKFPIIKVCLDLMG
jgi:hypothetical protein